MDRPTARKALGWVLLLLLLLAVAADLWVRSDSLIRRTVRSLIKQPTPVERIIRDLRP
ncbi:MAG: hypothetical protein ACE5GJ_04185 [Gemmatimonadota bacterium]